MDGKVLEELDDVRQSRSRSRSRSGSQARTRDPQLGFTVPADGDYLLTVRDAHSHGGQRYVYRLTVQKPKPEFELKLQADSFAVKRGSSVEVSVTVDRTNGFEGEIDITCEGLPTGVSAAPVKSLGKGDSAKSVKLVLQATEEAQSGPFQVSGKSGGEAPMERRARLGGEGAPTVVFDAFLSAGPTK
jgi:hypothetical protein